MQDASEKLHEKIVKIGQSSPVGPGKKAFYLKELDYSVVQQCIHCGMCLPTCPTYDETKFERNSPRGRIALMRQIADGNLDVTKAFGEELYFCLGCLACETACPAGVNYAELFENARADIERAGVLNNPMRTGVRGFVLRFIFTRPKILQTVGYMLRLYQRCGLETLGRKSGILRLLPSYLQELEKLTPRMKPRFSDALIQLVENPKNPKYRVGMLSGCVQSMVYSDVNRDTVDVLLANDCEVVTPRLQSCCGSLHAHNGELELSREMARRNINAFDLDSLDAIISNAAGCGSHLKNYGHLLEDDPVYAARAKQWSEKLKDIHEWLSEIGIKPPRKRMEYEVTYHEACHLCHGQKITRQPRELLKAIPGIELKELPESNWCCGSAGIYNITQPEMSRKLLMRKMENIKKTEAEVVVTSNPGCLIQLESGAKSGKQPLKIMHTISLLAKAYKNSNE